MLAIAQIETLRAVDLNRDGIDAQLALRGFVKAQPVSASLGEAGGAAVEAKGEL